jgi:prepilin-type N-terminal cleavage/methylation domain-containing protein
MSVRPHRPGGEHGFSLSEVLVVMAIVVIVAAVSLPALDEFYRSHQLNSAATEFQGMVLQARMNALKEKVSYRLVVHDENATTPNRFELQTSSSGSWVSVPGGTREIPESVVVLGSGFTDSVDAITVSTRGACSSGKLYLESTNGHVGVVKVDGVCYTAQG